MENAVKALTIAGGLLISIMIIAALVYASGTWQIVPKTQDESAEQRQLSLFNQQYESYARDGLYGTDLISILNKAIDNNTRYDVKPGENMYINIKFTLLTDVKETNVTYKEYRSGEKKGQIEQIAEEVTNKVLFKGNGKFEYQLSDLDTSDKNIQKFLHPDREDYRDNAKNQSSGIDANGDRYRMYTKFIPDVSEFKTRIFKCETCEYELDDNKNKGRIICLTFKEQDPNKKLEEIT